MCEGKLEMQNLIDGIGIIVDVTLYCIPYTEHDTVQNEALPTCEESSLSDDGLKILKGDISDRFGEHCRFKYRMALHALLFFLASLCALMGTADNDNEWNSLIAAYKAVHSADVVLNDKDICQRNFVIGSFQFTLHLILSSPCT